MKEFLQTNKMTYNLMSFTAFKSLLVFSILLDGPKTYQEIRDIFLSQEYLNETFSIDTLRVYINSLERMGCEIKRDKKTEGSRYRLLKHPFEFEMPDDYVKQLIKVFKYIIKDISVAELIHITKFFTKISTGINNEELKNEISYISPLTKIDNTILDFLVKACANKDNIEILYDSPSSGIKNIEIIAEDLYVKNNKIYLSGESKSYRNKANILVSRIKDMPVIKINQKNSFNDRVIIRCEIYDKNILLLENESFISSDGDVRIIDIKSDNIFRAKQRVLSLGKNCKVISPESFKNDILLTLKSMQEGYID